MAWIIVGMLTMFGIGVVCTMIARAATTDKATAQARIEQLEKRTAEITARKTALDVQYKDVLAERAKWRKVRDAAIKAGVAMTPNGIGDLVIYGDGFVTTGSFLAVAHLAQNAWNDYGEAYAHGRASFGLDYSWEYRRSGSYLLRNAQRTVKPCKTDAQFVQHLTRQVFNLKKYRVIVLSRGNFEPCTVDGIGFYPVCDLTNKQKLTEDLMLWYRIGCMENEVQNQCAEMY